MEKKDKKGIALRMAARYIKSNVNVPEEDQSPTNGYLLTESQRRKLRNVTYETFFYAALIGVIAVLAVVIPFHLFSFFQKISTLNLFGFKLELELMYTIYAIVMLFPEIWALNYINVRAVRKICEICRYPSSGRLDFDQQILLLSEAGLEIPAKHLSIFQIDPFIGLSKFSYYSLMILTKLKATLSNVVVKLLVKRFLGRYALRVVTDLAGIPIFAFWNAWASRGVIIETRMRIMATAASEDFLEEITDEEIALVYDKIPLIFNFIAQKKRSYNFALYAYIKGIADRCSTINFKVSHEIKLAELFEENNETKNDIVAKLLVFGFIVDGTVSIRERLILNELCKSEWFDFEMVQIETIVENYIQGKGIPRF